MFKTIKDNLLALIGKQSETSQALLDAARHVKEVESRYIAGDASLDELQAAQSALAALEAATKSLSEKEASLRGQLKQVDDQRAIGNMLDEMAAQAKTSSAAYAEYSRIHDEFDRTVDKFANDLFEQRKKVLAANSDYQRTRNMIEAQDLNISSEMTKRGVDAQSVKSAVARSFPEVKSAWSLEIGLIEHRLRAKHERDRQRERTKQAEIDRRFDRSAETAASH